MMEDMKSTGKQPSEAAGTKADNELSPTPTQFDSTHTYEYLGAELYRIRVSKNLDQKDIAMAMNLSSSCYGYYERGQRTLPYDYLLRISYFYQIPVEQLIAAIQKDCGNPPYIAYTETPVVFDAANIEIKESDPYETLSGQEGGKIQMLLNAQELRVLNYYRTRGAAVRGEIDKIVNAILYPKGRSKAKGPAQAHRNDR